MGSSVIDFPKSVNVNVNILNYNLGPLASFVDSARRVTYKSVKLVSGKLMALEVEVSRMERSEPILVITDGWYLKHVSTPTPA